MSNDEKKYDDKIKKNTSKKGVLLTIIIVIAVISTSFIVWFLPQGAVLQNENSNMTIVFSDPALTLSSVESQYNIIKEEFENSLNATTNQSSNITNIENLAEVSTKQIDELMLILLNGNPTESLLPSYVNLMNDLKNYSNYLSTFVNNINSSG